MPTDLIEGSHLIGLIKGTYSFVSTVGMNVGIKSSLGVS